MKWMVYPLFASVFLLAYGQRIDPTILLDVGTRPARIDADELAEIELLPESRRQLIESALALAQDSPWLPYRIGSADPALGGFDCSGAMYFVMRKAGLDPARSAAGQMEWIKNNGGFHEVAAGAEDLKHPSFSALRPGDLLFWAVSDSSGQTRVHHVAMYLGRAKSDGLPLIINSTDGRTYRGRKGNGYGVYDFTIPKKDALSKLVGYGTPPGID